MKTKPHTKRKAKRRLNLSAAWLKLRDSMRIERDKTFTEMFPDTPQNKC